MSGTEEFSFAISAGIVCFSLKGGALGKKVKKLLEEKGIRTEGYLQEKYVLEEMLPFDDLFSVTEYLFTEKELLIFVGACGIAVRAVAPYLKRKTVDPAVLVMDECSEFVISLLSGHMGRANSYAAQIAGEIGAQAVITTATDLNGVFAVDDFAVKNGLKVLNPETIKTVSSGILAGEKAGFFSELPVEGEKPDSLYYIKDKDKLPRKASSICILSPENPKSRLEEKGDAFCCRLLPMDLAVGMGCREGKPFEELKAFLEETFARYGLWKERIFCLCSLDKKAEEKGLKMLAKSLHVPFITYTAERLNQAEGVFAASDFVKTQTGCDNVCERSACTASGNGKKIIGKISRNGMTLSVYQRALTIKFEG